MFIEILLQHKTQKYKINVKKIFFYIMWNNYQISHCKLKKKFWEIGQFGISTVGL